MKNHKSKKSYLPISFFLIGVVLWGCATTRKTIITAPEPELNSISCIAVLPFDNLSGFPEAGKIMSDILTTELYRTRRFNILEWEEAISALKIAKMTIPDQIGPEAAQSLGKFLGVEAVLIGVVSDFSYGSTLPELRAGLPSIAFTARLIETKSGKPLWASAINMASTEFMEPRRQSINHLTQLAAAQMVKTLVPEKISQPLEKQNICWQKISLEPQKPQLTVPPIVTPPTPPPSETPSPVPVLPPTPPKPKVKPKIAVLNASGVEGVEENIGLILLMKNWDVATLAKYPYDKVFPTTTIYCRSGYEPEAQQIELEIPGTQKIVTTEKMAEDVHITILVGKDQISR